MPTFPEFSLRTRQQDLAQLKKDPSQIFDVVVVGGGITGAAVAREAALRGLYVLLVEKGDFASGTSSRSSKLVHGGVRYLEQFEFGLVMESTRERARLWKLAPQLVHPIPFLFPAYKNSRVPLWKLSAGLWLYDILAAFRSPTLHRTYLHDRCLKEEPALRREGLSGGIFYWDGATDDSLLTLANLIDARSAGAIVVSRLKLDGMILQSKSGKLPHTFLLEDQLSQDRFEIRARSVVVAGGPWTDLVLDQTGLPFQKLMVTTRGSHIVVPHQVLPTRHALAMTHPQDGRVLFTIPWGEFTVIGTTDIFDKEAPEKVAIDEDEVEYLINSTRYYYPQHPIQKADVVSTWSGLRPLIAPSDPEGGGASQISREHHLEWREEGIVVIAGGKLTTHRQMAEETVDLLLRKAASWPRPLGRGYLPSKTHNRPFPVLSFVTQNSPSTQGPRLGTSEASQMSIHDIRMICQTQMVMTIEDLFVRRTQIFYKEPLNGWLLLPKLKTVLCESLCWDDAAWQKNLSDYASYLETNVLTPLHRTLPALGST